MQHDLSLAVSEGEVELHPVVPVREKPFLFPNEICFDRKLHKREFISSKKINREAKKITIWYHCTMWNITIKMESRSIFSDFTIFVCFLFKT
jgi:hypothetical protein